MTLYSVDEINGDTTKGLVDEAVTTALQDGIDEEEPEQEASNEDRTEEESIEDILALSTEALDGVTNQDYIEAIQDYFEIDDERKALNARKENRKVIMEGKGCPRASLDAIYAQAKTDPRVRAKILPAFIAGSKALGLDMQAEMFPKH